MNEQAAEPPGEAVAPEETGPQLIFKLTLNDRSVKGAVKDADVNAGFCAGIVGFDWYHQSLSIRNAAGVSGGMGRGPWYIAVLRGGNTLLPNSTVKEVVDAFDGQAAVPVTDPDLGAKRILAFGISAVPRHEAEEKVSTGYAADSVTGYISFEGCFGVPPDMLEHVKDFLFHDYQLQVLSTKQQKDESGAARGSYTAQLKPRHDSKHTYNWARVRTLSFQWGSYKQSVTVGLPKFTCDALRRCVTCHDALPQGQKGECVPCTETRAARRSAAARGKAKVSHSQYNRMAAEALKDAVVSDCPKWKAGRCSRGERCAFRHLAELAGVCGLRGCKPHPHPGCPYRQPRPEGEVPAHPGVGVEHPYASMAGSVDSEMWPGADTYGRGHNEDAAGAHLLGGHAMYFPNDDSRFDAASRDPSACALRTRARTRTFMAETQRLSVLNCVEFDGEGGRVGDQRINRAVEDVSSREYVQQNHDRQGMLFFFELEHQEGELRVGLGMRTFNKKVDNPRKGLYEVAWYERKNNKEYKWGQQPTFKKTVDGYDRARRPFQKTSVEPCCCLAFCQTW